MKKMALTILLLFSALAWAGGNANPADYTLNIHVNSSRLTDRGAVRLKVTIDGKNYELQGIGYLLLPGDYKAKLAKDWRKNSYEAARMYEFLLPDQKTRTYRLVGILE